MALLPELIWSFCLCRLALDSLNFPVIVKDSKGYFYFILLYYIEEINVDLNNPISSSRTLQKKITSECTLYILMYFEDFEDYFRTPVKNNNDIFHKFERFVLC